MESNNWHKETEDAKVWWLDTDELVRAFSFDKTKTYYLPADYPNLTDEERAILDAETGNFWRDFFDY